MQEIWKDIPWYEWKYQASNLWRISSVNYRGYWEDKILSSKPTRLWYVCICLTKNGKEKFYLAHRLVTLAFLWEILEWMEVNHKNGIKHDNELENLEYVTRRENQLHSINVLWHKSWLTTNKWKFYWDSHRAIRISMYKNNIFVKSFTSIREASETIWITWAAISMAINWKRKTAWWFIWKHI